MFTNTKSRKYLVLFLTVFLLFVFSLSACSEKNNSESQSEGQIIPLHYSFDRYTLGDTVAISPTIAYGVVLEKSEYAEVPDTLDFLSPDEIVGAHYHRKVTMQVKKGIKNCKEGDIITYWEAGGKTKDGRIYVNEGFDSAEPEDTALVFITDYKLAFHMLPVEDNEGNVSIPGDFMIGQKYSELTDIPDSKNLDTDLSMEEYIKIVEKVVREQAE